MITLGSLFSGSGSFELAGSLCGIKPIWNAEIEKFPRMVTDARFPNVEQLGDVTKINGAQICPVDIITFGSPCQNMSIAGNRKGITGEKSILFFDAIRIIKEMRNATHNQYPRFAVWENVRGALSSNKGEDFYAVIKAFADICEPDVPISRPKKWNTSGWLVGNGWSFAWRLYDAQYWGIPQRRKRIYCIADFTGERAGEILFKPESMSRHSQQGYEAWQSLTSNSKRGIGANSNQHADLYNNIGYDNYRPNNVFATLRASSEDTGGGSKTLVVYV